jgi:hypothetical protein
MSDLPVRCEAKDGVVTFTIPIAITVSIGPAVLAQPQVEAEVPKERVFLGGHVGVNWNHEGGWGWYSYCRVCGCNRHLVLNCDGGWMGSWMGSWMAWCNVCNKIVDPPPATCREDPRWQDRRKTTRVPDPQFIPMETLDYQKEHPTECDPPPRRTT